MTLHKLLAATVCALLLTGCSDTNDKRIETHKKCQAAGMDSEEASNGWGESLLICVIRKEQQP